MSRRLLLFALVPVAALFVMAVMVTGDDFAFSLCGARALLSGNDPYAVCHVIWQGRLWATYPLTTILAVMPFVAFGQFASAALFLAITALLAFAILRTGPRWRLFLFASVAFFEALRMHQWSPLITAAYLLPGLYPLALVKPHIGLPVLLLRFTWRRALAAVLFLAATFVIYPTWPLHWWQTARTFDGFIPLLSLPFGPLLALAALRWRDSRARLLLIMALIPQRDYCDTLILWLLPQSSMGMLALSFPGWLAVLSVFLRTGDVQLAPWLIVLTIYVPALVIVWRPWLSSVIHPLPRRDVSAPSAPHLPAP